jgi:hypothetical protein
MHLVTHGTKFVNKEVTIFVTPLLLGFVVGGGGGVSHFWHRFWKGFTPVLCVEYLEGGSGRRFGKNSSTFQNLDSFYTSVKQCFFLNFLILQM